MGELDSTPDIKNQATQEEQTVRIHQIMELMVIGYSKNHIVKDVAKHFGVSERTAYRLYGKADKKYRDTCTKDQDIKQRYDFHIAERLKLYSQLIRDNRKMDAHTVLTELAKFEGFSTNRLIISTESDPEQQAKIQSDIEEEIDNRAKSIANNNNDEFELKEGK